MTTTALWVYLGSAMALAAAALALAAWAFFADRSRGRRRCPKCWYHIHESLTFPTRCSECGRTISRESEVHRTRRRWKWIGASVPVLFVAALLAVQPKVQPYGWGSLTPMTALLFLLQLDEPDWVVRGIGYQIDHDLFHRLRAPDMLDHWDPAKERAMWRWQWRWLGRTILPHLDDESLMPEMRNMYFDWAVLCRNFAGDAQLRAQISEALHKRLEDDDSWTDYRGWLLTVDFADIDGSIERLLNRLEIASEDPAIWGAMLGIRAIALRDWRGVELLLDFLEHEHPRMRSGAVSSLGFIVRRNGYDPRIHEAVDAMAHDDDCNVRWARIGSLAYILTEEKMWPMVVEAMQSEDICIRRGGFSTANAHGWDPKKRAATMPERVVELAVGSLDDEDQRISWFAAWIVREVAGDRRRRHMLTPYIDAIEAHAEHEDAVVQQAVELTLRSVRRQ